MIAFRLYRTTMFFMFLVAVNAHSIEYVKPTTIKLSAIDHPAIMATFASQIIDAYGRLGIRVQINLLNGARGLIESSSGRLDGEMGRLSLIENYTPSLLRVPVTMGKVRLYLYCRDSVPCSAQILDNRKNVVGVTAGENGMNQYMESKLAATFTIPNIGKLGEMLERERLYYVLGFEHESGVTTIKLDQFQNRSEPLLEDDFYHYIHEKHRPLLADITEALTQSLLEHPLGEPKH